MPDLSKMRARWPAGSAEIIGGRRDKDYGTDQPVMSWRHRMLQAVEKQFKSKADRDEAAITAVICLLIAAYIAALYYPW